MADAPAGKADDDWRDDAEADKLRDEAFRRLLDVPPKPQKDVRLGKGRRGKHQAAGQAADERASAAEPTTRPG